MIFCFDFDLTLTDVHSGGFPKVDQNYFSESSLAEIRATFGLLQQGDHGIYIVTRGMENLVKHYISLPRINLSCFISDVYGADQHFPVEREGGDRWGLAWAQKKVGFLNTIVDGQRATKNDIYFFDDTKVNIDIAIESGFSKSHYVGRSEHGAGLMPFVRELLDP